MNNHSTPCMVVKLTNKESKGVLNIARELQSSEQEAFHIIIKDAIATWKGAISVCRNKVNI